MGKGVGGGGGGRVVVVRVLGVEGELVGWWVGGGVVGCKVVVGEGLMGLGKLGAEGAIDGLVGCRCWCWGGGGGLVGVGC